MDLGIDKEFIESKKIEDVYWAKEIVDVYEFDEEISDREKNAIICAVLKSALLGKDRTDGRLLNIVSFLKSINVREEDISGYIMCSAINNRNGPLAYGDLLPSAFYCWMPCLCRCRSSGLSLPACLSRQSVLPSCLRFLRHLLDLSRLNHSFLP